MGWSLVQHNIKPRAFELTAAGLADWNRENEGQEIGYKFTKKTAIFDSKLETENGALIEVGLDC